MIRVTANWTDWTYGQGKEAVIIHPTPGRDRPLVVNCSTPFTAAAIAGILERLGCTVEKEHTP